MKISCPTKTMASPPLMPPREALKRLKSCGNESNLDSPSGTTRIVLTTADWRVLFAHANRCSTLVGPNSLTGDRTNRRRRPGCSAHRGVFVCADITIGLRPAYPRQPRLRQTYFRRRWLRLRWLRLRWLRLRWLRLRWLQRRWLSGDSFPWINPQEQRLAAEHTFLCGGEFKVFWGSLIDPQHRPAGCQ